MTPEQERKLNEVYEFIQALKSHTTIPFEVDTAFRERFSDVAGLSVSSKGADTEDQVIVDTDDSVTINTYTALGDPDGFLEINLGGTTYYLPYFT